MPNNSKEVSFTTLDLGSVKPTSVPMETIEVVVTAELFGQYAQSFVKEAFRVNPLRAEQVKLTPEEVEQYVTYLLHKRIECINGNCADFRKLKCLYIPSWIQFNLSVIGKVVMRDVGLTILPVVDSDCPLNYEQACVISEKIGMFMDDLQIVQDAMPRSIDGDIDVMSTALVADYVQAIKPVQHVVATYISAFLGMKLREEATFGVLYRVRYDDLNYIATTLTTQRGLY